MHGGEVGEVATGEKMLHATITHGLAVGRLTCLREHADAQMLNLSAFGPLPEARCRYQPRAYPLVP